MYHNKLNIINIIIKYKTKCNIWRFQVAYLCQFECSLECIYMGYLGFFIHSGSGVGSGPAWRKKLQENANNNLTGAFGTQCTLWADTWHILQYTVWNTMKICEASTICMSSATYLSSALYVSVPLYVYIYVIYVHVKILIYIYIYRRSSHSRFLEWYCTDSANSFSGIHVVIHVEFTYTACTLCHHIIMPKSRRTVFFSMWPDYFFQNIRYTKSTTHAIILFLPKH